MTVANLIQKKNILPVSIKSDEVNKYIIDFSISHGFEPVLEFNESKKHHLIYLNESIENFPLNKLLIELKQFPDEAYSVNEFKMIRLLTFLNSYKLSLGEKYSLLSSNGKRLVTHHGVYSLFINENQLIIKKILNRKNAVICSISPNGNHIIFKEKRAYILYEVNLNFEIELSQLDPSKNYYFLFSRNSRYFATVDESGEFIYHNIAGQGLIKFEVKIESYLSLKTLSSKKYLTTEEAIYDFSGKQVVRSNDKYIFHFFDSEYLVRENLISFQIEVLKGQNVIYRAMIQSQRFVHHIEFHDNRYLVVNLDDEQLDVHDILSQKSYKINPDKKIKSTAIYQNEFFIVLLENNDVLLYNITKTFSI
jgi:hypothetical protein